MSDLTEAHRELGLEVVRLSSALTASEARIAELERLIKIEQEDCLTYSNSEDAALARVERLEWGLKTSDGAHDITLDELNKAEARIKELEESDKMAAEIIQAKSDCIVGLHADAAKLEAELAEARALINRCADAIPDEGRKLTALYDNLEDWLNRNKEAQDD